jgi:hypothetical protein
MLIHVFNNPFTNLMANKINEEYSLSFISNIFGITHTIVAKNKSFDLAKIDLANQINEKYRTQFNFNATYLDVTIFTSYIKFSLESSKILCNAICQEFNNTEIIIKSIVTNHTELFTAISSGFHSVNIQMLKFIGITKINLFHMNGSSIIDNNGNPMVVYLEDIKSDLSQEFFLNQQLYTDCRQIAELE